MTTTYSLLIYRTGEEPSDGGSVMDGIEGHRRVQAKTSKLGSLHAVAQLKENKTARHVRIEDGSHDVVDGPYIEAKEWLVGFYLVDCETEEEALEYAKELIVNESHAVEVRPVNWRWKR